MRNPVTRAALALVERRRVPDPAQILSALPVPVVMIDADNRFRYVNHAAEQFLGISASGLSQLRLRDLVPEDNPLFLLVQQVRQGDATVSDHDLWGQRAPARRRCRVPLVEEPGSVLLFAGRVRRPCVGLAGVRGAARSVTGMAAILAHEVKNPLSGIRGAAQLLETTVDPQDRELAVLIRDRRIAFAVLSTGWRSSAKPIARTAVSIHRDGACAQVTQ